MIIYVITIILSVFLAYSIGLIRISTRPVPEWIKVIIVSLPSILVTGFRYNVGTDYNTYRFAFENPDFINVVKYFEVLNRLYFKIIARFGGSFYTAIFIASVIYFIIVYMQIFRESPIPWLSTFLMFGLLFFFVYMNIMRQMIAISILLLSIRQLADRKYFHFLMSIALASCIHRSSIIFILILILMKKEIKLKTVFWITPAIFLLSSIAGPIIARLADQLKYSVYLEASELTARSIMGMIWQLLVTMMACYTYNLYSTEKEQRQYRIYFNVQVLALWSHALVGFIRLNEMARLQNIFRLPSVIYIPIIISRLPKKYMRMLAILFIVIYGLLSIYMIIAVNNEHGTLPYQTIFSVNI